MTGIDARQANVASFRVSFSVFSPRKTPFELAISIKNDETEESNLVRSVGGHQSVKSIHKNTLLSIATELLEIQSATLVPEGHFYKKHAVIHDFPGKLRSSFYPSDEQKELHVQLQNRFSSTCMVLQLAGRFLATRALTP